MHPSGALVTSCISSSSRRWQSIPVPWDGATGTASLDRLITVPPDRLRNRNLTGNADSPAEDQRTRAGCPARLPRAAPEVSAPATLAASERESGEAGLGSPVDHTRLNAPTRRSSGRGAAALTGARASRPRTRLAVSESSTRLPWRRFHATGHPGRTGILCRS
jgi:hypothetical protein